MSATQQCQLQVQMPLQITKCSYDTVVESVFWDWGFLSGHKNFPAKYDVEGQESFIISLESTARVSKVQFLQRCNADEEGARPVPLSEHVVQKLGPIFYKRCEGTIKTADRKYSVSFLAYSKISHVNIDTIKKLFQEASTDTPDIEDLRMHPWNENKLIGIVDPVEDTEFFIHEQFWDFNPYQSAWESHWKPEPPREMSATRSTCEPISELQLEEFRELLISELMKLPSKKKQPKPKKRRSSI